MKTSPGPPGCAVLSMGASPAARGRYENAHRFLAAMDWGRRNRGTAGDARNPAESITAGIFFGRELGGFVEDCPRSLPAAGGHHKEVSAPCNRGNERLP